MANHHNGEPATCALCLKEIRKFEWVIDLFRQESAHGGRRLEWAHEECAKKLSENYVKNRERRQGGA